MRSKVTITVTLERDAEMDVQGVKEAVACNCETYGKILFVDVEQEEKTDWYEQMQLGFPREEMLRMTGGSA